MLAAEASSMWGLHVSRLRLPLWFSQTLGRSQTSFALLYSTTCRVSIASSWHTLRLEEGNHIDHKPHTWWQSREDLGTRLLLVIIYHIACTPSVVIATEWQLNLLNLNLSISKINANADQHNICSYMDKIVAKLQTSRGWYCTCVNCKLQYQVQWLYVVTIPTIQLNISQRLKQ